MPLLMPVYGTRPEAIKMAPLVSAIERSEYMAANDVLHSKLHKLLAGALR